MTILGIFVLGARLRESVRIIELGARKKKRRRGTRDFTKKSLSRERSSKRRGERVKRHVNPSF